MKNTEQIKAHWDEKADSFGQSQRATHGDTHLRELEVQAIEQTLGDHLKVIDVGCGNGYSTLRFAKTFSNSHFQGVDYSQKMIEVASDSLADSGLTNLSFSVMDVLDSSPEFQNRFDVAITERCLINLTSHEDQLKALKNLSSLVKSGGKLILSEESIQSYRKINGLRLQVGLPEMSIQWHNLYLDMDRILEELPPSLSLLNVHDFSSSYYLGTRFFKAFLYHERGWDPGEDVAGEFNRISTLVPPVGDYGLIKIYEFVKE
ncbi:class I SAM-dependent methyltransferase [bacterium]|jgi:ubiquinone/menaquinone biosynthesis C-methylase UbiE|nr:class I SAM-dependent methyltransferase [bacterium]